ncbi:hypothetical protein A2V82_04895 [candidate division KSB1 bacterium RBG_16_48_16]|nr:MAG: hypothetical protein A2V82_04895 [candidate division KSB1 bacterium RBG_16_48_16]
MEPTNLAKISDVRILSRMARSIADEIRNPLTGIAGTVSLLKESLGEKSSLDKLRIIDECIVRIDSFIEDLYLLSRPVKPCFIQVDLGLFVEQVTEYFLKNSGREYQVLLEDTNLSVSADIVLLQQAITNILKNAVDATGKNGMITISIGKEISTEANREVASIKIQDNGKGINARTLERLFTPFYSTKHQGRGLGLVIALNYINIHNGDIKIESKKSQGTVVSIELPLDE